MTETDVDLEKLAEAVAKAINMAGWNHHAEVVNAKQHTIALAEVARAEILKAKQ